MLGLAFLLILLLHDVVPTTSPFIALVCMPGRKSLIILGLLILCILAALLPMTRVPFCDEYDGGFLAMPWLRDIGYWAFSLYALILGFAVRLGTLHLRRRRVMARGSVIAIHLALFLVLLASPLIFNEINNAARVPSLFCKPSISG